MRIAVLGIKSLPATGGADRVVERIVDHAPGTDIHTIYVRRGPTPSPADSGHRRHVRIPALPGKHLGPFSYFLLCTLHYLVRERHDLVHVHNSDFGVFCPLLRLRRAPVLGTFHGDPYRRGKWGRIARAYLRLSERLFVEFCDRLTSVSRFRTSAMGIRGSRPVEYIPNGLDIDSEADTDVDPARFGVNPGDYVLFAAGRVDPTKGLHHLVEAYAETRCLQRLLVVGDFSHDASYADRIRKRCRMDHRIVIHDRLLPRGALMAVLRGCRAFVFPSEVEGMSMMLLEAVAQRRPVVCSRIPENVEVVGADHPYLFDVGNPADLRAKLESAITAADGESRMDALVANARNRFSWTVIAARYRRIQQELVTGSRSVSTPADRGSS